MIKKMLRSIKVTRLIQLVALAVISIITILSPALPLFSSIANALNAPVAASSVINIPSEDPTTAYSCQAYFTTATENSALLDQAFYDLGGYAIPDSTYINSNDQSIPGLSGSQLTFLASNWGKTIPIVKFAADSKGGANQPVGGEGSLNTSSGSSCNTFVMVDAADTNDDFVALSGTGEVDNTTANNPGSIDEYKVSGTNGGNSDGTFSWDWSNIGGCESNGMTGKQIQTTTCGYNAGQKGSNSTVTAKDIGKTTGSYSPFVVAGAASGVASGPVSVNGLTISWNDVDEFTITSASGTATAPGGGIINYANYKGETYEKVYWGGTPNGYEFYFLNTVPSTESASQRTTWGQGPGCVNPMVDGQLPTDDEDCGASNGDTNCVPFFAIQTDNDETSDSDDASNPLLSSMQSSVDGIATSPITFFDYTPNGSSCSASTPVSGSSAIGAASSSKKGVISETDQSNAKIWLFYDASQDKFATVFTNATTGSHEANFIGTYGKGNSGNNLYIGPTNGSGCSAQIQATPNKTLNSIYSSVFTFYDATGGCNNTVTYGHINVEAQTVSDAEFNGVSTASTNNTATTPPSTDVCDNTPTLSFIDPILCGLIHSLASTTTGLDCDIGNYLKIDTNVIFDDTGNGGTDSTSGCSGGTSSSPSGTAEGVAAGQTGGKQETAVGEAYYTAWQSFRDIAYAILVIIFLIMVAAQILDVEQFNAYALRRMLPAAAVAIPLVAISWNAQDFVYNMSNDAYDAIRAIIAAPFVKINVGAGFTPGSDFTLAFLVPVMLVATGIGLTLLSFMSLGGIAMLILAGLVAVFSAWVILLARTVVATFLIVSAPVAIICSIFKPFRKLFDIWATLTVAILLSTPAVGAELQISHDAAKIAFVDGHAATAFILLIAGYAILWQILKAMDKVAGKFGDVAASATQGVSKMAKKKAKEDLKYGLGRAVEEKDGPRGKWNPKGMLAGAVRRNQLSREGGWGMSRAKRDQYAAAKQKMINKHSDEMVKEDAGRAGGNDLTTALAQDGNDAASFERKYAEAIHADTRKNVMENGMLNASTSYAQEQAAINAARGTATTPAQVAALNQRQAELDTRVNGETNARTSAAARSARATAETSFGAKMGSEAMQVAAFKSRLNSKTSYNEKGGWFDEHGKELSTEARAARVSEANRKTQAGIALTNADKTFAMNGKEIGEDQIDFEYMQARMTKDAAKLVKHGIITTADAATIIKQRGDRSDRSGVGHGVEQMLINNAVARLNDNNIDTGNIKNILSKSELKKAGEEIMEGSGPGQVLAGRHETVRAMVPVMVEQVQAAAAAVNTAITAGGGAPTAQQQKTIDDAQRELKRQMASMAALQDISAQAPSINRKVFGEGVLGANIDLSSIGLSATSIGNGINGLRTDQEFQLYRREFNAQYLPPVAAAAAAAATGGTPPPPIPGGGAPAPGGGGGTGGTGGTP